MAERELGIVFTAINKITPVINDLATQAIKSVQTMNTNASKGFGNLESNAENSFKKLEDASGKATENMEDDIVDYTKKSKTSLADLAGGFYLVERAVRAINSALDFTDGVIMTQNRLKLLTDDVDGLNASLMNAANNARTDFQSIADATSKIGISAGVGDGGAFDNTDQLVAFTETLSKSFSIAGTDTAAINGAMTQLSQAMSSGVLRGEELNSVLENSPLIAQALADHMGIARGALKDVAAEGLITSDILLNSVLGASDEINQEFNAMPRTFSQNMSLIKNGFYEAFIPLANLLASVFSSPTVLNAFNLISIGLQKIISVMGIFVNFFVTNWNNLILPILIGVAIVILPILIANLWAMIPPILTAAIAFMSAYFPVILLILTIAGLIQVMQYFGMSTIDIFKTIANVFLSMITFIVSQILFVINFGASMLTFIKNFTVDWKGAIQILFLELFKNILSFFDNMVQGIVNGLNYILEAANTIFGLDVATIQVDFISNAIDSIDDKIDGIATEKGLETTEFIEMTDVISSLNTGIDSIGGTVGDFVSGTSDLTSGLNDVSSGLNDVGDGLGGSGTSMDIGNVGNVDTVDTVNNNESLEEDTKYLREQTVQNLYREMQQQYNSVNIVVNQADEGISSERVLGLITEQLNTEMAIG